MARNIKRYHNGKDRRKGDRSNRTSSGKVAAPTNPRKPQGPQPIGQRTPHSSSPCCKNHQARVATNERLLRELRSIKCDRAWDSVKGDWVAAMPVNFVRKHRMHMKHFRAYANKHGFR